MNDTTDSDGFSAPAPIEVQHFGPAPTQPTRDAWGAGPIWPAGASGSGGPQEPRRVGPAGVVAIALVTAIVSGSLSAAAVANLLRPATSSDLNAPVGSNVSQVRIDESSAVIGAVARVMPSVVTITARSSSAAGGSSGIGSGFIFDAAGWILTNRHVVAGADQLEVTLNDSRVFSGRVYGIDTLTDLAIVKIDATGLPPAPIGTSDGLELGQLAIAIGNPLGTFRNTVTPGSCPGSVATSRPATRPSPRAKS